MNHRITRSSHLPDKNRIVLTGAGFLVAMLIALGASAKDWPQWCGSDGKNMVSQEKGLPTLFVPGEKRSKDKTIDLATAQGVKWGRKICEAVYSTPSVAGGKIFVGGMEPENGLFMCLDAATGRLLWQWKAPPRKIPHNIGGFSIGVSEIPEKMGVCSSAAVDGDRIYFVSNRFDVVCLDVHGQPPGPKAGQAKVVWSLDMWDKLGVFPCDAANGSPVIDGELLYVQTSNGVDRNTFANPSREQNRKVPAPNCAEPDRPGEEDGPAGGHRRHAHRRPSLARAVVVARAGHGGRPKAGFLRRRRRPVLCVRGACFDSHPICPA